ncbi:adenylate/guanylate cyclase domain-containing protein [Nocardioides jiangxiensis]|uniref:Adenylate/guanylate cyclase domain-containing protein n=1 Tax=Nocardioides jiangxiensis TaxID=3064524 RepID=A0ABT9B395_9ACTN|nr:adenylate/guanylate cyclase domain-containing protein [Nocardioides sp. WY-20]MDO7867766.1 adenylate/guanylate cyclase domain-containing protein [Nocardioides sp. WY-20]
MDEDHAEAGDHGSPASGMSRTIYDDVTRAILGEDALYTRTQVSAATGIAMERLTALWRALGFPSTDDDAVLFTDADIAVLELLPRFLEPLGMEEGDELTSARSMGRSFSRLADWEVRLMARALADVPPDQLGDAVGEILPVLQQLQDYVWRRHLARAAGRALLAAESGAVESGVGFVDMVAFTRTSRELSMGELAALLERFDSTASALVASHGGRVVKTIGDEILFVVDDPHATAEIASTLALLHEADPSFPQVRAGVTWGPVLHRLGDVFGETVNIASRLTSLARPGTVLANPALAELVGDRWTVRRIPPEAVRGYSRLEAWVVRPPAARHAAD